MFYRQRKPRSENRPPAKEARLGQEWKTGAPKRSSIFQILLSGTNRVVGLLGNVVVVSSNTFMGEILSRASFSDEIWKLCLETSCGRTLQILNHQCKDSRPKCRTCAVQRFSKIVARGRRQQLGGLSTGGRWFIGRKMSGLRNGNHFHFLATTI